LIALAAERETRHTSQRKLEFWTWLLDIGLQSERLDAHIDAWLDLMISSTEKEAKSRRTPFLYEATLRVILRKLKQLREAQPELRKKENPST
jgi:hypothetical protein